MLKPFCQCEDVIRLFRYFLVGCVTTLMTIVLWNFLLRVSQLVAINLEYRFSVTQYLASFLMIFPSFWLHRYITFRDKTIRSAFSYTTVKVYVVYILSPFVASIFTYYYLVWFPDIINFSAKVNLLLNYNLPLGKYFLQTTSLAIGMLINYSGQRLWIYK